MQAFSRFRAPDAPSEFVKGLEENPLFVLSELGTRTLRDYDRLTPQLILMESSERLCQILKELGSGGSTGPRRDAIEGILILWRPVATTSIEVGDQGTLDTVLRCVEHIHRLGAEEHFQWHESIELNEFAESMITKAIKQGLTESVQRGLYMLGRVMIDHLKTNVPPENQIWMLHWHEKSTDKVDHDKSLQWDHVSTGYMRIIGSIGETAAKCGQVEVVSTALSVLARIQSDVLKLSLGDLQKDWICRDLVYWARYIAVVAVQNRAFDTITLAGSPFTMVYLVSAFEGEKTYAQRILVGAAETLVQIAQLGALRAYNLNDFVAFGRGCVRKVERPLYREALIVVINTLDRVRAVVEPCQDDNAKTLYLEAYDQLMSLERWIVNEKKNDPEISGMIREKAGQFTNYDNLKRARESGVIKWPTTANTPKTDVETKESGSTGT